MSKRSRQDLVESARPLLAQHGTLSVVYLMRKLRIDWDESTAVLNELGMKTREQEIDDFVERAKKEMKDESEKHFNECRDKKIAALREYNNSEKGREVLQRGWKKRNETMKRLKEGLGDVERWKIRSFYKACPKGHQVDHIVPVSKGGAHCLENLQYLPIEKNKRKFTKSMHDAKIYFDQLSI